MEQKIELLIEEYKNSKKERKRENILNKLDSLYNVLITISTFALAILISQHFSFNKIPLGFSLPIIGIILSLLVSYSIGVKAMITDSLKYRLFSWSLLVNCLVYASILPFWALNNNVIVLLVFFLYVLSPIIPIIIGRKLYPLLGEEKLTSEEIYRNVSPRILYFTSAVFVTAGLIVLFITRTWTF